MINRRRALSRLIETGVVHYAAPWQPPVITVSVGPELLRCTSIWTGTELRTACPTR